MLASKESDVSYHVYLFNWHHTCCGVAGGSDGERILKFDRYKYTCAQALNLESDCTKL
jgi:hypothetical protein